MANLDLKQIIQELAHDTRPNGPDGASNVDRIAFVSQMFQTNSIDLGADYDFSPVIQCQDEMMVEAAKHLALLKLDLIHRIYDSYQITLEEFNVQAAVLILAIQRINWHIYHLSRDLPTPPFSSIH